MGGAYVSVLTSAVLQWGVLEARADRLWSDVPPDCADDVEDADRTSTGCAAATSRDVEATGSQEGCFPSVKGALTFALLEAAVAGRGPLSDISDRNEGKSLAFLLRVRQKGGGGNH